MVSRRGKAQDAGDPSGSRSFGSPYAHMAPNDIPDRPRVEPDSGRHGPRFGSTQHMDERHFGLRRDEGSVGLLPRTISHRSYDELPATGTPGPSRINVIYSNFARAMNLTVRHPVMFELDPWWWPMSIKFSGRHTALRRFPRRTQQPVPQRDSQWIGLPRGESIASRRGKTRITER